MTRNRARKKAIRSRMDASEEPYSVAARKSDEMPPASDTALREVMARVNATLAAPSARFEYRRKTDPPVQGRQEQPRPGPVGRLARLAARTVWNRLSPELDAAQFAEMLQEGFRSTVGVGMVEPAADRYQVDYGGYAQMYFEGQLWAGGSGVPLEGGVRDQRTDPLSDPLGQLRLLRDVTQARYGGEETLRGTPCRTAAVAAGSAAFTVWIDDEHVRQIQFERGTRTVEAFEFWDFGVPADSLDWSHLPGSRVPG